MIESMSVGTFLEVVTAITIILWVTLALVCANLALEILYMKIDPERYAIVLIGSDPRRILWNSTDFILVFSNDPGVMKKFPLGRFIPVNEQLKPTDYLGPKLGPIEKLFGIRFIGIPWIHKLYDPQLSWNGLGDDGGFVRHTKERRVQFSITSPFFIKVSNLRIGGDIDHTTSSTDDDMVQRFQIALKYLIQTYAKDPIGSLFGTNWLPQMTTRLQTIIQPVMGKMSLDEFILLRMMSDNSLMTILKDPSLGNWGREMMPELSSYSGFEFEGDTDGKIAAAVTAEAIGKFLAKQKASLAEAGRAGDLALIEKVGETVKELTRAGATHEVIMSTVTAVMQAIGIGSFNSAGTLVGNSGGGGGIQPTINIGDKTPGGKT